MNTLLIFGLIVYLVGFLTFITDPSRTTIRMLLALTGLILFLLHCLGLVHLPACLS